MAAAAFDTALLIASLAEFFCLIAYAASSILRLLFRRHVCGVLGHFHIVLVLFLVGRAAHIALDYVVLDGAAALRVDVVSYITAVVSFVFFLAFCVVLSYWIEIALTIGPSGAFNPLSGGSRTRWALLCVLCAVFTAAQTAMTFRAPAARDYLLLVGLYVVVVVLAAAFGRLLGRRLETVADLEDKAQWYRRIRTVRSVTYFGAALFLLKAVAAIVGAEALSVAALFRYNVIVWMALDGAGTAVFLALTRPQIAPDSKIIRDMIEVPLIDAPMLGGSQFYE